MFSEEKEHERRGLEKQKNGSQHSSIRHRIPYRLLGRRSLGAKRLVVSSKVLFPAIPTQNCDVVLTFPADTEDATLMWLLARLKSRTPALTVHVRHHSHTGIYGFYLTALYENLLQGAEELGILKPLKSEYGGGMKEFIFEDQDCFAGVEEEASFLTSQERQSIVLHFLHDLRATGEDSLEGITFIEGQPIVPLLITKKVISQVFPLHNHDDLRVLRQTWVQAIFSKQPLNLVCRYFGVKIGLYFAYLGHYTTWLILPALVGLIIFLLQGDNQQLEDLCFVGFALFNTVWATLYLKFWVRASIEYCYKWGTLEKKDELLKDPRPLFKGDLVKSPVTGHLEFFYPSWKRLLFRYFVTFPVIAVCLAFVFVIMLLCFELQEWVNELIEEEELPYMFSFLPKVLLAVVVSILDEIYKQIAIWLTYKENYRLEESHETSLVIKVVMFVNSFLSLFYIGFYLKDMDRLRDQLAALLITRQVLGNLKEALTPYIIWKARLYSVGYRIATRMSPASVEKEMRRMTAQSRCTSSSNNGAHKNIKYEGKERQKQDAGKNSDSKTSVPTEEDEEGLPALTQAEVESAMKKYEDTLDDYLEMCIQFGYITLFSSAFPLAAVCALLNNVIEIRSDAFKLCFTYQRSFGQRVESIGIWQDVLLVISVLAVIVNCALIGTSGLLERVLPGLNTTAYCVIMVIIEHLIITTKFALYHSVPDLPPAMATEMARLEYQRSEALKQLVSQMAPNQFIGNLACQYPGSPSLRRKRFGDNLTSEPNIREASPLSFSPLDSKVGSSSPTVIAPTSNVPRPSDIFLGSSTVKPVVPPRSSLQKTELSSGHAKIFSPYHDVAEKVVAAALNPIFDGSNMKNPSSLVSSSIMSSSAPSHVLPSKPVIHSGTTEAGGTSAVMRRVYRSRADLETWRRKSEPVPLAIKQALDLRQKDEEENQNLKRRSVYENEEDLSGGAKKDTMKKGREKMPQQNEVRRSRDQLNILDNGEKKIAKSQDLDRFTNRSSSSSRISSSRSSLPPTPPSSSSSSLSAKYAASPRLLRGGLLGDPSAFAAHILSRKSRSFSSTDVNEARQAFRDRISWRGDSTLDQVSSEKYSKKKIALDDNNSASPSLCDKRPEGAVDTSKNTVEKQEVDSTEKQTKGSKSIHSEKTAFKPSSSSNTSDASDELFLDQPLVGSQIQGKKDPNKTESGPKLNIFNRAMRESASKPLSILSRSTDFKGKES